MKLKHLLIITTVTSLINAPITLVAPVVSLKLYGIPLGMGQEYMAQWAGLGTLVIGLLSWFSLNIIKTTEGRKIIIIFLIYYIIGFILSIIGLILGTMSTMGWYLSIIFLLLAIGYTYFILKKPKLVNIN